MIEFNGMMMDVEDKKKSAFSDVSARLVDLRGIARPPTFSGKDEEWPEFRFRMEAIASLLGCEEILVDALKGNDDADMDLLTEDEFARSKFLYNLLVQICHGRALALIRLIKQSNGEAAWRRLVMEYEPDLAGRHCAILAGLLTPTWTDRRAFVDQLLDWEFKISEYELATHVPVPDAFKCAVVLRWGPVKVREFLRLSPVDLTSSYALLKSALQGYVQRGREYDVSGLPHDEMVAMDVSAVWKGKSKGKGKNAFDGNCLKCGMYGHRARTCSVVITNAPVVCTNCNKRGHLAKDCRGGKGKGKGAQVQQGGGKKGLGKGKGASSTASTAATRFEGVCFKCGTKGHRAADCRRVLYLSDVPDDQKQWDDTGSAPSYMPTSAGVSTIQTVAPLAAPWIVPLMSRLHVRFVIKPDITYVLVDSGAYAHVCPVKFAPLEPLEPLMEKVAISADGRPIKVSGKRTVRFTLSDGALMQKVFRVTAVSRPILSVGMLEDEGIVTDFHKVCLWRGSTSWPLERHGNLYYLPVTLQERNSVEVVDCEETEARGSWQENQSQNDKEAK